MGYELIYACLVGILMQYIMILVVKYIIVRKKKNKRKKCKRRILIAIGIIILMYLIGPMARFSSLENAANFYIGKENVGKIVVKGLDDSVNEMTYEFKETKAPKGYSINETNANVKWDTEGTGTEAANRAGSAAMKDSKLSALPSTGGIGTTIFTIAGCLIMVTAAGLFFASRKKANK